jgi:hypothetical protein
VEFAGGWSGYTKSNGEKKVSKWGKTIDVFVDPHNPSQSVIDRGGIFIYVLIFLVGVSSILLGLINFFSKS